MKIKDDIKSLKISADYFASPVTSSRTHFLKLSDLSTAKTVQDELSAKV